MTSVVRAIKYRAGQLLVSLITFGAFAGALADDITGVNRFVCAPAQVTICDEYGSCVSVMPWEVNVPRFLVFDLKKKQIATTEASGENRSTPIQSIVEEDDAIYLQGCRRRQSFQLRNKHVDGIHERCDSAGIRDRDRVRLVHAVKVKFWEKAR